jgi:Zn-dependent peptidase ImmA (M78 family)
LELSGNPPTIDEAIRMIVAELLHGIPVAPTDLEALKETLNISEFSAEDVPFSGELRRQGKKLKVVYSIHLSENRRRFTIAHELGHALMKKAGQNRVQEGTEVERLCDMLATEILMPRNVFEERIGIALTIDRVFELRRIFQVSLIAIAHRCFELERASVFELDEDHVNWASGLVKKGPFQRLDGGLQLNIKAALQDTNGSMEVYFSDNGGTRRGELQWSQISPNRTLFLLKRSDPRSSAVGHVR